MNRATQGLQISLIISVMLNVVLGVTTYLFNKQAFEKGNAVTAASEREQKAAQEKKAADDKFDMARTLIGIRDADIEAIKNQYREDQANAVGASKPVAEGEQENIVGYSQLVKTLCAARDDRTGALKAAMDKTNEQDNHFKVRESASADALNKLDQGFKEQVKRVEAINESYRAEKESGTEALAHNKGQWDAAQKASADRATAAERRAADAQKQLQAKDKEIEPLITKIRDNLRDSPEPPTGEVVSVSLPTKTVWIDRGRADELPLGIRFDVFAKETNTSPKAVKKGVIEVTRVLADHQAECRIVKDTFSDPLLPGDKIFNAFWSPGQENHFALAGVMNLDGDGRHQVNVVIGLIKTYGGVVDCWLDEQGHRQGQITTATQYLIQGDKPDKSAAEMGRNDDEILRDAKHYQLHVWPMTEFKQKMDYRKTSTVERFGSGATNGELDRAAATAKAKATKAAPAASKAPAEDDDVFGK